MILTRHFLTDRVLLVFRENSSMSHGRVSPTWLCIESERRGMPNCTITFQRGFYLTRVTGPTMASWQVHGIR
jgi:hypothetical protein